ncbi:MAG: GNAT family N-acetyltransferase [Deltaproteobacteria bacterium]|nr:GNAT family N-acetyltransferase [Deltaproteobacteria bacterium]
MELTFQEDNFVVKTLSTHEEFEQAMRLRHDVFAEELKWVPASPDRMERDRYDNFSESIGVFDMDFRIAGYIRLITSSYPFMVDKEFACMLPEGVRVKRAPDMAEVTRLCVKKEDRSNQYLKQVSHLLYKGLYHWNRLNEIRHSVMVVDARCFRLLRLTGLPVEKFSDFVVMPDGVKAGVCTLDWHRFDEIGLETRSSFHQWMSSMPVTLPIHYPVQSLSHELYLQH